MKNDKENNQELNIETNNDAVLYSVMRSFLKRKSKEYNCCADDIYLTAEFNKINIYKETEQCGLEFVESERV